MLVAALCATAAAALFSAGAAPAAISTGSIDPASGFPFSYTDDINNVPLQLCQDNSGNCIETPRPNPALPISVPDNFTPDEEGFWWLADATVPNAGIGLARFAKEAAFDTPGINLGHQVSFSRVRFRFGGLTPNATYRVTHPFGVDEIQADAGGIINQTTDVGCLAAPCGAFPLLAGDPITAFLQWDSSLPATPAGYVGNPIIPHTVQGSPLGTNFVRLERLDPPAIPGDPPVAVLIGQTDQFLVQGKLAGPPPPPAPHLGLNTASVDFGGRQVGNPSGPQTVTITNHGTANMAVGTLSISGTDASDFAKDSDSCSGQTLAPTASCSVSIRFTALHAGSLNASLLIPSNAPNNPHSVALSGTGTVLPPPPPPAPAGGTTVVRQLIPGAAPAISVLGVTARPFAVTRLSISPRISRKSLRSRGLRITMRLPKGTQVVRLAVYRFRNGKRTGNAIATATRLPNSATGTFTVTLKNRRLLRLSRGRYVVLATPSSDQGDRGVSRQVTFTVD